MGGGPAARVVSGSRAMARARAALELACGVGGGSAVRGVLSDRATAGARAALFVVAWG